MTYFKIDDVDFSNMVKSLNVSKTSNYNAQTNAAGDTVVDYINAKKQIDVGVIYLKDDQMKQLQNAIDKFNVVVSYRNPKSGLLETANCIVPDNEIEYFTIQTGNVIYNETKLKFIEL